MKNISCLLLSLFVSGLATVVLAQPSPAGGMGERFFPALGRILTDDQRRSLGQIVGAERAQLQPLERELRTSRQALLNEIAGGSFDENAVRKYADQSARAESELTVMFARALWQMQPPLTPAQIQQLKNFQPGRFQESADASTPPQPHLKIPPALPRDTNDLPVVQ